MKKEISDYNSPLDRLAAFVLERHRIYLHRKDGDEKPWTADPILQRYRFCNVYRELDAVTVWIRKWAKPHAADPLLWFATVMARLLNLPESLNVVGYPIGGWHEGRWIKALHRHRANGGTVFNAAYIVSTNGIATDKIEYLAECVLTPMWLIRARLTSGIYARTSLAAVHELLLHCNGMGNFMAAQVIADLKNTKGQPLAKAPDFWTWAALGPGSRRGLNRAMGRRRSHPFPMEEGRKELLEVQRVINKALTKNNFQQVCAQDAQNCLCEFDKYERALHEEGRPKQRFNGTGGK